MAKRKTVRMLLSISQEKLPKWYEVLHGIENGYVRAEIIRAALNKIDPATIQIAGLLGPRDSGDPKPADHAPVQQAAQVALVEASAPRGETGQMAGDLGATAPAQENTPSVTANPSAASVSTAAGSQQDTTDERQAQTQATQSITARMLGSSRRPYFF